MIPSYMTAFQSSPVKIYNRSQCLFWGKCVNSRMSSLTITEGMCWHHFFTWCNPPSPRYSCYKWAQVPGDGCVWWNMFKSHVSWHKYVTYFDTEVVSETFLGIVSKSKIMGTVSLSDLKRLWGYVTYCTWHIFMFGTLTFVHWFLFTARQNTVFLTLLSIFVSSKDLMYWPRVICNYVTVMVTLSDRPPT